MEVLNWKDLFVVGVEVVLKLNDGVVLFVLLLVVKGLLKDELDDVLFVKLKFVLVGLLFVGGVLVKDVVGLLFVVGVVFLLKMLFEKIGGVELRLLVLLNVFFVGDVLFCFMGLLLNIEFVGVEEGGDLGVLNRDFDVV